MTIPSLHNINNIIFTPTFVYPFTAICQSLAWFLPMYHQMQQLTDDSDAEKSETDLGLIEYQVCLYII